jgi:ferredoxin-NADP reductase/Fe-S-cluster-containing hydrogenase component 2
LASFQELRWPRRIDDPLTGNAEVEQNRRLRDTVLALNRNHITASVLVFEADGTGTGIIWKWCVVEPGELRRCRRRAGGGGTKELSESERRIPQLGAYAMNLSDHPTVKRFYSKAATEPAPAAPAQLDADWLRRLALDCGADDAGLVELARPGLDPQREEILRSYPWTKSLLSFVVRMAREPVRGGPRSVANLEFHRAGHEVNEIAAAIVAKLESHGVRAVNPSMGFPMEMYQGPAGAVWVVSHKPVAVEAGLGHMGIHRNVIHPKYGNFVLLGTVLMDCEASAYDRPIDYNPCLECKLCVATCPVGAIGQDGSFNFSSCITHNYREFLGGFSDWIEQVADARDAADYRRRISDPETASMWQSLSYGANYKSAYCMAVCPAGEEVVGPYLRDKQGHLEEVVRPLQERAEPVYVVPGSDAEAVARRKFKNKTMKPVASGLRPRSIAALLNFMPYFFQPNQSRGLDASFHFTFTGQEKRDVTITIKNRTLDIQDGLAGKSDVHVTADSKTWLGYLAKEKSFLWALIRRKIRIKGNPRLLLAFGKCFPSAGPRHRPVEILPQSSKLRREPPRYQKNDPATGKIRWLGKLTLAEVEKVTHNVKTFRFKPRDGGSIPFAYLPGQFLTLHIAPRGIPTKRSYTIASTPTWHDRIEITVKREDYGLVSRWLHEELRVGDEVEIEAPNGTFFFSGEEAESVVLIGGGVGITPMMSAARYLTETRWPGKVDLILGFRAPRDFIFREEIAQLQARNPNLRVTVTMSAPENEPWSGAVGRIDAALLASAAPNISSCRVHLCGPPSMMDAVKAALVGLGVPNGQIKTEAFGTVKRDPRAKGVASTEVAGKVFFQTSDTTAPVPVDATILDAADEAEVFIDNACRSGTCGSCRVKLVSGSVNMAVKDALTEQDQAEGYILTCQARIQGDVKVEA